MQVCLVRHAEPDWMPGGRRNMDPELTDRGHQQAELLATRARDWPAVQELWVSPAVRSQQTAAPLADALGLKIRTLDWLLEVQPDPRLEGMTKEEIRQVFRDVRQLGIDAWWEGPAGSEHLGRYTARVNTGFNQEVTRLGGERREVEPHWAELPDQHRVVIVSHIGTSATLLAHLLGVQAVPWSWYRFRLGHAAMSVVRTTQMGGGQIFSLHSFDDRSHHPPELRTI